MRTTLLGQTHLLSAHIMQLHTFMNPAKPANVTGCVWPGKETVAR